MTGKIFINYRRDDSAPHALSVYQYLERAFGARNVFIDIDRIRAGEKFPEVLERRLTDCKVMVAVIGPHWLEARGDDDRRRLDDPTDWVRLEIVRALARNITVIPVTVGGAELPKRSELPEELQPLLDYQAGAITTTGFRSEMAGLLNDIRAIPGPPSWWRLAAGAAAAVILAGGTWAIYGLGPPVPGTAPGLQADSPAPQREARQLSPKERIAAATDRTELVDLMRQNPAEQPAITERLGMLGYVAVATAAAGERWLKAGGGREEAERFKDCAANETWCPEMVVLAAGRFLMGSPKDEFTRESGEDDGNGKQVRVTILNPLAVGRFAVTRGEFAAFISDAGRNMGGCRAWSDVSGFNKLDAARSWRSPGFEQTERHPATCINWADAKAYVDWLSKKTGKSYRLPSEAEREYMTRAETTTPFWWGSSISTDQANYEGNEFRRKTMPVDSFAANPWGLHQVHGNVWEWVEDCNHDTYSDMPSATRNGGAPWITGCANESTDARRILRGGAWNNEAQYLRAAVRLREPPLRRYNSVGFRVVRAL